MSRIELIIAARLPPKLKRALFAPRIPSHLANCFTPVDEESIARIRQSLVDNFFPRSHPSDYLSTQEGKKDLFNHLIGRLNTTRSTVIPWLDSTKTLRNTEILEIGCGTGASTIALSEQGAKVTALDMDEVALRVAKLRCTEYGLEVKFVLANAIDTQKLFAGKHFEMVIFYGSLEHMTHLERMKAMKDTWDMLRTGDLWVVVEAPNRLWYYDHHTSWLPFFVWLPDDLAFEYSRYSPRGSFRECFSDETEEKMTDFLRRGRGVSYHEFELTMNKPINQLEVVSCLSSFLRRQHMLNRLRWRFSTERSFEKLLSHAEPHVHPCFYQPALDLIIRKS